MYLNVMPLNELAFPIDDRVAVAAANKIFPEFGNVNIHTSGIKIGVVLPDQLECQAAL